MKLKKFDINIMQSPIGLLVFGVCTGEVAGGIRNKNLETYRIKIKLFK